MEETVVRDKAVESACVVIALMQGGQHQVRYMEDVSVFLSQVATAVDSSTRTELPLHC